jgi:uncharacterized membrane protein YjjP (DUF1212 family)
MNFSRLSVGLNNSGSRETSGQVHSAPEMIDHSLWETEPLIKFFQVPTASVILFKSSLFPITNKVYYREPSDISQGSVTYFIPGLDRLNSRRGGN